MSQTDFLFTVVNIQDEEKAKGVQIGTKLKVSKTSSNDYYKYLSNKGLLLAAFDNGATGYVAKQQKYLLEDAITFEDMYDNLPKEFDAEVVSVGEIPVSDDKTLLAVNIRRISQIAKLDSAKSNGLRTIDITIKGSQKDNPAKSDVIQLIEEGTDTQITIRLENNKIVAYLDDTKAGIADEKSVPQDDISIINKAIKKESSLQGKATRVIGNKQKNFIVTVEINTNQLKGEEDAEILAKGRENALKILKNEGLVNQIETLLRSYDAPDRTIGKLFSTIRKVPEHLAVYIPKPQNFYEDYSGIMKALLIYLSIGKHINLVGDKGVGKNKLIETIAFILQRPLLRLSASRELDKEDITGSRTMEDSNVVFSPEALTIAMEYGCILNIDEINTANPGLLTLLHGALDWSRTIDIPHYKTVKAHDNFQVIATMNEGYNGTLELNQATADRFTTLRLEYPEKISMILRNVVKTDEEVYEICDKIFEQLLNGVKDDTLTRECLTVRGFITAIEAFNEGLSLKECLVHNVIGASSDETQRSFINEAINLAV